MKRLPLSKSPRVSQRLAKRMAKTSKPDARGAKSRFELREGEKVVGAALVPREGATPRLKGSRRNPGPLPRGNEAQCPTCDRIFSSDTAAEKHKRYTRPATVTCKDPAELGMIPVDRDGRTVWVRPTT